MKKIISILLSFVMIISLSAPAFAANETTVTDIPTIYLSGKGELIYRADGTAATNPSAIDRGEYIKQHAEPALKEIPMALLTGDYTNYINALYDILQPLYADWVLDSNGSTETGGTHINWDAETTPIQRKTSGFGLWDYHFRYDWRLSPLETADELDKYIERVVEATGSDKVNIHARCLGTNIAMAYIAKSHDGYYNHDFRVNNIVLNTPAVGGYILVGSLLSGSVKFDADTIDQFASIYLNNNDIFDDPLIELVVTTMLSLFNQAKVLGWGTEQIQKVFDTIADEALPKIALCCYGSFPSYWSMISDEYYDKAIAQIFNTPELKEEYRVFIEKTNAYHELLGDVNEDTGLAGYQQLLLDLKEEGVNTAVYAKYGTMSFPLFEGSNITGDSRGTVTDMSFGAKGTIIGETFDKEYVEKAKEAGLEKYISPDLTVDASTALLPDTTWFIKNIGHADFPAELDTLSMAFLRSGGTLTVETAEGYSRFMDFKTGTLEPVTSVDHSLDGVWAQNWFLILLRVIEMIIDIFASLFK